MEAEVCCFGLFANIPSDQIQTDQFSFSAWCFVIKNQDNRPEIL